jgi:hypothetical protein
MGGISDLNKHLFAQLDRLGDEKLEGDALKAECDRAEAIVAVSDQIVRGAAITLQATKLVAEFGAHSKIGGALVPLIEGEAKEKGEGGAK